MYHHLCPLHKKGNEKWKTTWEGEERQAKYENGVWGEKPTKETEKTEKKKEDG